MAPLPTLRSLTNRIFAATALLVVLAVGFTAVFVTDRVTAEAEAELQRGLVEAARAVERRAETVSGTFTLLARLIADLPRLKAAMATGDGPTVQPVLAEYRAALQEANVVAVTDPAGRILAIDGIDEGTGTAAVAAWSSVQVARTGAVGMVYTPHPRGVLQVISVPVTLGRGSSELAGTLSVGFVLDGVLAGEFKALTGSEITFGLGTRVRSSTLPGSQWPALARALHAAGITHIEIDGDDYVALSQPIGHRTAGSAGGDEGRPAVLVARSRTERLRFLRTIQTVTFVTVLVAVLAATVLSYAVARTVTRPLAAITRIMRDVAATGDLTRKIPVRPGLWEDEDARVLATTFNGLIDSIARFEREAAQRERLSSLGRLSSVIAHEIRNPLMIIKASVRTLRDAGAASPAVAEAATDISGEVVRLNRLVNEVLDFARPIRFEIQTTDINAVCGEAAAATQTGEPDVSIVLDLDADLPRILSDGERLRAVLINALANACQAVRSGRHPGVLRDEAGSPGADVTLTTQRLDDQMIRIDVLDIGPGIDAAMMSQVFEPFVTTRRGGTGLGLAIAKNVVEGLGGSITLQNRAGGGARVRLDLPHRPPGEPAIHPESGADTRDVT